YVLGATGANTLSDVGTNWGKFDIKIDKTPPTSPAIKSANGGENQFVVSWSASGEGGLLKYKVYAVPGCLEDADAGELNLEGLNTVAEPSASATSASIDVGSINPPIELDSQATIAVQAIDQAENASAPALRCVTRQQTDGFCARVKGNCKGGCAVGNPGARPT